MQKAYMLQGYDSSRKRDLMSALVVQVGLSEREAAFVGHIAQGCPMAVAVERAGFSSDTIGYQLVRRPHVLAAIHTEVQRQLAYDAPTSLKVLKDIRDDIAAPPRVRADIGLQLMKMAGHVQPTNRDKDPEKQISEMTREEMIAYIDRNQAEIDKAVDELAARAKDVSAAHSAQTSIPSPTKPLDYLG